MNEELNKKLKKLYEQGITNGNLQALNEIKQYIRNYHSNKVKYIERSNNEKQIILEVLLDIDNFIINIAKKKFIELN